MKNEERKMKNERQHKIAPLFPLLPFFILHFSLFFCFACTNPFMERLFPPVEVANPPSTISYTVTFDSKGGSPVDSQKVAKGEKATRPNNPTKSGFGFVNWYDNEEYIEPHYNFNTPVGADITLYAKWIVINTVTFNANGDGVNGLPAPITAVRDGATISKPSPDPSRTGYTFIGWYKEAAGNNAWDFDTDTVTEDITLYAKWDRNLGTADMIITVEQITDISFDDIDGGIIYRNADPTSKSFAYIDTDTDSYSCEWTIDGVGAYAGLIKLSTTNSCTVDATDPQYNSIGKHAVYLTVVKNDVPYKKAIWVTIMGGDIFTVTFITNGGSEIIPQSVLEGGRASRPTQDPEKDGYAFGGWYRDPACTGSPYDFDTPVLSDIILYAKWNIIPVTNITGVPTTATVGTPLTLTGTVVPSNATNKTIVWSVADAGTTDATISGSTLTTTAPGTVTVRATIANGTAQGTDYTQTFTITASLPFVAVENITGVPTIATAGTPLTLTSTVVPTNATNNTTPVWSVQNAGTTGASISGDTLNTTAPGTVTVRATIANGTAPGTDYTQNFTITVKGSFTITIDFADMAPSIEGGTIFRNAENGPQTLPLTVAGSFDSYQWSIDGNIIASETTSSFTVSANDPSYNHIGTHSVYLVVYKDGIPYSKTIYFEVRE